jgi:hypothetical protein
VPVVAIAVAAPAYAASATPAAVNNGSCKCPGSGANNFNFHTAIAFSTPGADSWSIQITSFTFDGTNVTPLPSTTILPGGDGNVVLIANRTNSQAKHTIFATYTGTNLATGETYQGSFGPVELTYPPTCAPPITCPV